MTETPEAGKDASGPSRVFAESPNRPRPDDALTRDVADMLRRIEIRYAREGTGPASRFEGRLLEDVQAEAVLRRVRDRQSVLGLKLECERTGPHRIHQGIWWVHGGETDGADPVAAERDRARFILVWRDERGTEICRSTPLAAGTRRIGIPLDAFCADLLGEL